VSDPVDQIPTYVEAVPPNVSRETEADVPRGTSGPAPMLAGKFALFETPDGGIHLAYRPDGADEDEHIDVPGIYVKMMKKAGQGRRGILGAFGKAG
jgi:hypothetical protein